jgi:hypothetical protein
MKANDRDNVKKKILDLFRSGRTLWYSDIMDKVDADLEMIVNICNELEKEGKIYCPDTIPKKGKQKMKSKNDINKEDK